MEFNEKLQHLRKQKNLTQEELAEILYVSRTAVSKWESGRGYPNIDSLKAISKCFGVTIDELLSGEELLSIAEENNQENARHFQSLVFGLLDCSTAMFFFLPLFGQRSGTIIQSVSLLSLGAIPPYLRFAYYATVLCCIGTGLLTLALQNYPLTFWARNSTTISLACNAAGVLLFIISQQPYAAAFLFIYLAIKLFLPFKRK